MAPPTLPTSLSPHVCILASSDVQEVLEGASLPPLPEILQCFSPLPQITTRTTSLTSVPHASFALRFSDVVEIEDAVHEDEEQRAGRMMDWMGSRISQRCQKWVDMLEAPSGEDGGKMWRDRTPWWEEVKRCVEGDLVPSSAEGWNHPVSLILAVTTTAANPLQALQDLASRAFDFPPWVDLTSMRYFLIIHPSNSPLADPIAEALFNAVKKQYGLHSFLLPLHLPTDPLPAPVPVPALPPRLSTVSSHSPPHTPQPSRPSSNTISPAPTPPPHPASPMPQLPRPPPLTNRVADKLSDNPPPSPTVYTGSTLRLTQDDTQQLGRFVREFVTMSLIPWMEKCVVEWNENYSSSRRLPSRLFSSTRRLFGASSAQSSPATPTHGSSPSVSSVSNRFTHGPNSSVSSITSVTSISTMGGGNVNQQRRLAEFATILGDYKLAISVWETLRKEGRGGSDILPLLSAPSPALSLHAEHSLTTLRGPQPRVGSGFEAPAHAQYRALAYAVRWETGIDRQEFLNSTLEGERWLVKAAYSAEEPPTAILFAHAAFLSEIKGLRRKAAFWYLIAAEKLEKTGIKPLAMFFFRKARSLYRDRPPKELSPSFWESEDRSPTQWEGFTAVLPAIEHELGRLLYTTGDTASAIKYFLGLLKPFVQPGSQPTHGANGAGSPLLPQPSRDKVYLEDFRVAFRHFRTTEGDAWKSLGLQLPITFCQAKHTRVRFPGDAVEGDSAAWEKLEQDWEAFWSLRGKEKLGKSGQAAVNETFWVDIELRNPLDVEVTLSGLTVSVREASAKDSDENPDFVEVETIDDIVLGAKDTRMIPVSVNCTRPAALVVTQVVYEFFSLLPAVESLAVRGRRLNDTPAQRQDKSYAPDVLIRIDVEEAGQRLHAHFVDDRHLNLAQGEYKHQRVWLTNSGTRPIKELWVVTNREDELWYSAGSNESTEASSSLPPKNEVLQSTNTLAPREPYRVSLDAIHSAPQLEPGEEVQLPFILHAAHHGEKDLSLLFVFREADDVDFYSTRVTRRYEVKPILKVTTSARPSPSADQTYIVTVEVENVTGSSNIEVKQLSTMSATWESSPMRPSATGVLCPPHQVATFSLGAQPWTSGTGVSETRNFVANKIRAVLQETPIDPSEPPSIDLTCTHIASDTDIIPLHNPATHHFIHCGRRTMTAQATAVSHPDIPARLHQAIFPLYNPSTVDVVLFWEIPAQKRAGHILLQGPTLGAGHAALREIVQAAKVMKVKRSMYAETQRERAAILEAVQACEWNREDDPVAVFVQDGAAVEHDFRQGPCHVPVAFTFRNLSRTHPARVTLKLAENSEGESSSDLLPPPYAGRLTFHKILKPSESYTTHAKLWATRPGCYALDSWTAETEVGEPLSPTPAPSGAESKAAVWRSRQMRYLQRPRAGQRPCIAVVDVGRLA